MTANTLRLLVALAPIVLVLVLLAVRVRSLWAGVAGLGTAVVGSVVAFPLTGEELAAISSRMTPTILEVAFILLGGVGLAEAMSRGGAQGRIAAWLERAESGADRTTTLLLIAYGLTPFMESVTGFGLGVVITAPLLIRLGLPPIKAVVVGLLGLVLVPWGSLAPGLLVSSQLGGQDFGQLGVWSALLTLPLLVVSMGMVLRLVVGRPNLHQLGLAASVIAVEWAALLGANVTVGPPLSGILASATVIAGLLLVSRMVNGPLPAVSRELALAVAPYVVITGGILVATAVLAATGTRSRFGLVASPALWLNFAAVVAFISLGRSRRECLGLVRHVVGKWVPIASTTLVFMILGIVMAATHMAEHLATTAARAGFGFVATIPAIGALGAYLTGSNTGSAAMFSTAITTAATNLGASPLVALAGQNVAGSFAIIVSPPRVALATAVALAPGASMPASGTRVLAGTVLVVALLLGIAVLALG